MAGGMALRLRTAGDGNVSGQSKGERRSGSLLRRTGDSFKTAVCVRGNIGYRMPPRSLSP